MFDEPGSDPPRDGGGDPGRTGAASGDTATRELPVVERRPTGGSGRRVLDGAAFGVYEDTEPPSRWPLIGGVLLGLAVLVVGILVWRAVRTDAELVIPASETTTTTSVVSVPAPTAEDVLALVPDGLQSCVAPENPPADGPARMAAVCPRTGIPETVVFVLYASLEDRDAEFAAVTESFGVPSGGALSGGVDCALGRDSVHDYIGFDRVGRLACLSGGGVVDFVWTSDEAPLLIRARGPGTFADHYAFWARMVDRTDDRFPLAAERALLDQLPDGAACRRDLELNVEAAGSAAVVCKPADAEVRSVSAVQFSDASTMSAWIDGMRSTLTGNVFGEAQDACTPGGFGRRPEPQPADPATTTETTATTEGIGEGADSTTTTTTAAPTPGPDAGFTPYRIGASTGSVLCFVSSSGENVVSWTRDESLIGSIAVVDPGSGARMQDLLAWWESGGHRP